MSAQRLSRRGCLLAGAAALWACGWQLAAAAQRSFAVQGFDSVLWRGSGELFIEQGTQESLNVEAEPAVLARLQVGVRGGRLEIGFLPGRVVTQAPLRLLLKLRALVALESQAAGDLHVGALQTPALALELAGSGETRIAALRARSLDARLAGSGLLAIDGGAVERQHVLIAGASGYQAAGLASRQAEIEIAGSGDAELAAEQRLIARIAGAGNVRYRGHPVVEQDISGAGTVEQGGA
ncbi:GIN domain-containing protein [Azohydromonas lata]|uniref:GIN domain-containing protein n=1 Tax=Azohydromonas lata TaxID=45677 RepID=UPI00083088B3|nr:DUF2807 domain-containing protein [Azohydromonas lata]